MRRSPFLVLLLIGLLGPLGCDDGATSPSESPDTPDAADATQAPDAAPADAAVEPEPVADAMVAPDACVAGTADCVCTAESACNAGLFCAGGVCRAPNCDLGDQGCLCFADDTCRAGPDGRPMACMGGICTVTECPAGTEGCDCAALDACDDGLLCQRGECVPLNCDAGDLDCICADGGCRGGAICVDDRCVDPGCAPGTEGCACSDGACAAGLLCDSGQCVPACPAGRAGCACDGGTCDAGAACRDGACVALDCMPGTADCVCDADGACPAGRRCTDGLCQLIGCAPGEVGCACDAGACAAGLQCSALGVCRGCPTGAAGCACDAGACGDGLECDWRDTCVAVACDPGTEGCACAGDGECGLNTRGEPMACTDGRCVAPSCTPGDAGCPCLDGRACTSGADVCVAGFCQPADCAPGTLDCACSAGRCVGELTCRDGAICVEGGGFVGDACLADGSCLPGGICEDGICTACNAGALGCACLDGGCFGAAGCVDDVCIDQELIEVPPADPRCYTPCNGSFEDDDGVWRRCDAEGLLEGCLDGRACVDGACLRDGEARARCERDDQCPDYTRCIAGQCYSECRADADCGGAQECVRKVCRTPCQSDGLDANCPAGQYCATSDGTLGHCMQMVPAADAGAVAEAAALTLSESALRFSPSNTLRRFSITNTAPTRETLTLRKLSHVIFTADGDRETLEDPDDGEDCDPARGCPLSWLTWTRLGGDAEQTQRLEITLDAGETVTLEIGAADGVEAARWQGVIEIVHPTLNRGRVALEFAKSPAGQWTGNVFYFASFGTESLDTWVALPNPAPGSAVADWAGTKNDANVQEEIGNAFLQRWGAFRRGRIDWDELQAVLTATQTESWRWTAVQRDCPNAACYLYNSNRLGLREYSSDLDSVPVPTGIVELPFGMNIYQPDPDAAPGEMAGRIDSGTALHYAGDPAIDLAFDGDPAGCERTVGGACVTYLSALSADVAVGGRYETDAGDTACADYPDGSYTQVRTPWLLTDFMRNTAEDANSGNRYRYACRDNRLPLQLDIDPAGEALANLSLSAANPVPDGRARRRHIELIDGALINQTLLLVIFKERFESFLDPVNDSDGFEAYGFMVLTREGYGDDETDADENGVPDLYQGSRIDDDREEPDDKLAVACDPDLVADLVGGNGALNAARAGDLVNALIEGVTAPEQATYLTGNSPEQPHYLCYDTGTIDQACPAESRILYFTVDRGTLDQGAIDALDCQAEGTCLETYLDWRDRGEVLVQAEAPWRCAAADESVCSANRFDLRDGKRFFARRDDAVVGLPMRAQLDAAFRYKTRFRTRQGRNVGFAPEECLPDSNQIPYCYDPAAIEDIRARVDCLLHIQDVWHAALSASEQATLDRFMRETFAYREEANATGERVIYDGFERSYAELLIMLGDEAYTRSFASRFDLAGQNAAAFEGSLFETGGLDLAGQVGYEMYTLHQAVQYYEEVLDRFYALSPQFWRALEAGESSANFITPETVTRYLERLVRASSQKSRAWAQIADRYRAFNRPDLARPVIERAYTGAYLESIVMSRMMLRIIDAVAPESRPQIEAILLDTQRRYRIALNDMREAYGNISDQQTFFGIPPDYVPIPALDGEDFRQSNGFEVLLRRTQAKVQVAAEREQQAIESNRSFDSDAAQFQAELVRIRNTYEDQLASICGTFEGDDGVIYPAISLYADRTAYTATLGDPCGLTQTGELFQQYGVFEQLQLDVERIAVQMRNTIESAEIERRRAAAQCELQLELADFQYAADGEIRNLETEIAKQRFVVDRADRALQAISTYAQLTKCDPTSGECVTAGVSAGIFKVGMVAIELNAARADIQIERTQREISQIRREAARWTTRQQCRQLAVDSEARMADILLRLKELELEYLRAEYQVRLQLSATQKLIQQATRLAQQQAEAQQLQINAEAARNDPNVRIYRNDAIINADFSFDDAMAEAYRMTKVFEYYTSQSYADQERLYFVRLVQRGDNNLENYVTELQNAFFDFEEEFGLPDTRVLQVSLMNDILAIPRLDEAGVALTDGERTARLRAALRDPGNLDRNGYLAFPFSTRLDELSPLTRNHKVLRIESEIIASNFGNDHTARLYLKQDGTGVLQGLDGTRRYYRLPTRTAVLNPFFSGVRFFDPDTYRNARLRDRPLVNTAWTLFINQRDEVANQDIDLQSVSDIRLYVYYTDFTADL